MKRLISILLFVCAILSLSVILTSCGHEHTYKTEWKYDEANHWHECEGEDCAEVSDTAAHSFDNACDTTCACGYTRSVNHDFTGEWQKNDAEHWHVCKTDGCDVTDTKAAHTWNEGEITTPATKEADGVKTFTCTACSKTKTEAVKIKTTVTAEEWAKAFEALENCEIKVVQDLYALDGDEWILGQENTRVIDYAITEDGYLKSNEWVDHLYVKSGLTNYYYYKYHKNSPSVWKRETVNAIPAITTDGPIVVLMQTLEKFSEFTYNEETKLYEASNVVYINEHEDGTLTFEKVYIGFEDGKITHFTYVANSTIEVGAISVHYKQVIKFSFDKYGTATLTIPEDYEEEQ